MKKQITSTLTISVLAILFVLFFATRIKPILFYSLPYTYDQGRDFLRAAEMVMNKDLTFIGPTTGIMGVFHGVWWYYLLTIPFLIFHGSTIGFYYFNLIIQFVSLIALMIFIRKYFNNLISICTGFFVAISPYFIFTSNFIGNNIMVLPSLLAFLILNFILIEYFPKKRNKQILLFILLGISLGFVSEFEFAFGLMILPVYSLLLVVLNPLRTKVFASINFIFLSLGLIFVFIPRTLFEIKNNFSQTKSLIAYFFQPKVYSPKPYTDIVYHRLQLFWRYFNDIFPNSFVLVIVTIFVLLCFFMLLKKKKFSFSNSLFFYFLLLLGLFLISTFYKGVFWANYYEGIPYLFVFIGFIIVGSCAIKGYFNKILIGIYLLFIVLGSINIVSSLSRPIEESGLIIQKNVIEFIQKGIHINQNYCVRVYTPPIIPYTYDYLFLSNELTKHIVRPTTEFVNNTCWYIVESDVYPERKEKWIRENTPKNGKIIFRKQFKDVEVQQWQIK